MLLEGLLLLVVLGMFLYHQTKVPAGMPPGSFGLPLIGCLPMMHVTDHMTVLRNKYGKIFTTKWGPHVIVVISDVDLTKKAFSHPLLQGRMDFHSMHLMNHNNLNSGVVASYGDVWMENRRFLLRRLRDLGMGKTRLEASIQEESERLVQYLENLDLTHPVALDWGFNVAAINVIWQMMAGLRYEADDQRIRDFAMRFNEDLDILQGPLMFLDLLPWLIPFTPNFLYDKLFRATKLISNRQMFRQLANEVIEQHRAELDPSNPRDIIDYYLVEIDNRKDDPNTTFKADYSDLMTVMSDMFGAGSETTSSTLRWMVLYLAAYPRVQEKIHELLDREVEKNKLPSLQDRPQLAYIDAMLMDVLRLSSLVSNGAGHKATMDFNFEGYSIPKGTIFVATMEIFHRDPAYWEKPDELYPEHFLDDEGRLITKKEGFMPFAVGRRQCLGESLARMELFLFAAAILQRFTITPPPGVTLDTETDRSKIILNLPKPFKVMLKRRI